MIESSSAITSGDRTKQKRPESEARKSWILLRWLLILFGAALTGFLYLPRSTSETLIVTVAFALTNIAITLTAPERLHSPAVRRIIAAVDVLMVSATLYLLRAPGTYLYVGFIFVIVIAAFWRDIAVLLFSLATVSVLYGMFSIFRLQENGQFGTVEQFLTLAAFFIVSLHYLFSSERMYRAAIVSSELSEERRRADVIFEISRSISSALNTREVLYLITTRLSETFGAADCSVIRIDALTRTAKMIVKSAVPNAPETEVDLSQFPELLTAFDSQEILFVPNLSRNGVAESVAAIPMRAKNVVLGLIYIRLGEKWSKLSESDERFFRIMAATAANALKNAEMLEEMEHRARTDFLTGLPNHRSFQTTLAAELGRAQRHNHPLSLMIIDLDFLKDVNDRFGHPTGDMVIRSVGEIICRGCREFDVAARYGGEEFTVILPETPLEDAGRAAERIREMIAEYEMPGVGAVTASIGVSNFPVNALGKEDLIRVADQALYVAKDNGRDRVAFFNYQLISR